MAPFGDTAYLNEKVNGSDTVTLNFRFPGQYYDQESGLYYNMARYYDPQSGRYMQPNAVDASLINNIRKLAIAIPDYPIHISSETLFALRTRLGARLRPVSYDIVGGRGLWRISTGQFYAVMEKMILTNPNAYLYAKNSALMWTDPFGFWSVTPFEGYDVFGGGLTFGKNPDGSYFLSIRIGMGEGLHMGGDISGQMLGYDDFKKSCMKGAVQMAVYGTGGISFFGPGGVADALLGIEINPFAPHVSGVADVPLPSLGVNLASAAGFEAEYAAGIQFNFIGKSHY